MPAFTVSLKWGRETYKDVEVNTDEDPEVFKAQIYALTQVLPQRQKVMVKGKTLGETWENFPITPKATILLMGSKEEDISRPPPEKVKFVEDMNEGELASALELPLGLANLGNTCYMNATVQCLKTVHPLTEALKKVTGGVSAPENSLAITSALRDLYGAMDKGIPFPPVILLQTLQKAFPQFAERAEGNVFQQQDANELWTQLIRMLQQKIPPNHPESKGRYESVIDEYFGGRFRIEMKCDEAEAEEATITEDKFLQLSCYISEETKYMHSGLVSKLSEKIVKNSPTLGRDANYTKSMKIDRLPAFLSIQMVRFFYKSGSNVNAKMLRDVKFPLSFDAFDLCSKRLQEKLMPMREKFKELEDLETQKKLKLEDTKEKKKGVEVPFNFVDDPGSNNSGFYELQAVLTHKGRTSNSGHYVAWVKHKGDTWIMCDDDKVHPVTSEDVLKLSGGGDWHTAYVLLYGPRILELPEGQSMEPVTCEVGVEGEKMTTE